VIWRVSHCVFPYLYRQLRTSSLWSPRYCGIGDSPAHCNDIRIHFCLHTHKRAIFGPTHAHLDGCSYLLDWVHFLGGVVAATRATNSCVAIYFQQFRVLKIRFIGTRVIKSSILVFLALLALSPVLRTLTEATASDSIWALAAFLFLLHTLLADYTSPSPQETKERYGRNISLLCWPGAHRKNEA